MEQSTLTHGKYTIDIGGGGCSVYSLDENNQKIFLCGGIGDPELAMTLVEGLLLVEAKRFYAPDAERTVSSDVVEKKFPKPNFLKRA